MKINGIQVDILYGYKPNTKLSLLWQELSGGSFRASDRGIFNDKYETKIRVLAEHSDIYAIEDSINTNKAVDLNLICGPDEEIFGINVVHGSITGRLLKKTLIQRLNIRQSIMELELIKTGTLALSGGSDFDVLKYPQTFKSDREYENTVNTPYSVGVFSEDRGYETPIFNVSLKLLNEEMINVRNFLHSLRGGVTTWPVTTEFNIFGDNFTGSQNVRITEWRDQGRIDHLYWNLTLKVVKDQ